MVEADTLQSAIDAAINNSPSNLTHFAPARFARLESQTVGALLELEDGRRIKAQAIVGCDGVQSLVRAAAGIETEGRDYGKSVLAANVALAEPHCGIARQLFTPEGPFATLPLKGDRANLAWYMKRGAAEALAERPVSSIETELNARFSDWAGPMKIEGSPYAYPLILQIAEKMIANRVALVGDAARRINPLAGQGLNLGFKDVAAFVECLVDARRTGLDIGAPTTLHAYQAWRRFDATTTALAMDTIDRLFSNDNPMLKILRGGLLVATNKLAPVRTAIARQASADQPDLPKLMQGQALI
ncbi:MAG: FAD-dependent monooxygenase [Pseudomonadota bacterium]